MSYTNSLCQNNIQGKNRSWIPDCMYSNKRIRNTALFKRLNHRQTIIRNILSPIRHRRQILPKKLTEATRNSTIYYGNRAISIRRFWLRPSGVSLLAIGWYSDIPMGCKNFGTIPVFSCRNRTTFVARAVESSQLVEYFFLAFYLSEHCLCVPRRELFCFGYFSEHHRSARAPSILPV